MLKDVVIANKIYAKLNLADAETLDDIAVKVIKQDTPDFLVPFKMVSIDGETEIRYEIGEGTRLNYLSESMTKREFVLLLENMIRPFKICNDWFLDYHYFHLDSNYIFIGKNYTSVKYIYIPDANYVNDEESVLNFFRDFVLNINLSDDPVFVMNLYRHLKERTASLVSVLNYITQGEVAGAAIPVPKANDTNNQASVNREQPVKAIAPINNQTVNKMPVNGAPANNAPVNNFSTSSASANNANTSQEFGKADVKGDLISNLFGEEEGTSKGSKADKKSKVKEKNAPKEVAPKDKNKGFLGGIFGGGKSVDKAPAQQNAQQRSPIQQIQPMQQSMPTPQVQNNAFFDEEDVTFIAADEAPVNDGTKLTLQLEEDRGYHFPKFIEVDLSRGFATIGRFDKAGNAQADYNFEASLSFISRRHLRVEKLGEQYRVIDLGSGNGTLINNEVMVTNMPYAVKAGDRIIFSKNHQIVYRVC